jgi:hypothetical protein
VLAWHREPQLQTAYLSPVGTPASFWAGTRWQELPIPADWTCFPMPSARAAERRQLVGACAASGGLPLLAALRPARGWHLLEVWTARSPMKSRSASVSSITP